MMIMDVDICTLLLHLVVLKDLFPFIFSTASLYFSLQKKVKAAASHQ